MHTVLDRFRAGVHSQEADEARASFASPLSASPVQVCDLARWRLGHPRDGISSRNETVRVQRLQTKG